ncbi:PIN domain-containing protein [Geoglobus ahangari]|uniref:PIN domain-containing protein n=1 Tax=Geoglobus ahangari TaxID=113653 RepID=UPI001FE14565|nr:PIN domain-containing protein [Geoglobus ahangari]
MFGLFELLPSNVGIETVDFMRKYEFLLNDALIAATCRHYGIKRIATFDNDFERSISLK